MQRLEVLLEDDLTGGPADETVAFGVDGAAYEVDLNSRYAADFRRQLARFVECARPARPRRSRAVRTAASLECSQEIRAWAEREGLSIAERGRLPGGILMQYELARNLEQSNEPPIRASARRPAVARRASAKPRRNPKRS
jgi:hypothetical protein